LADFARGGGRASRPMRALRRAGPAVLAPVFFAACTIWNGVTLPGSASDAGGDASIASSSDAAGANGYSAEVFAASPIAYWRFDAIETSGGRRVVRDVSGHGRDCTASAGVAVEPGAIAGMSAVVLGSGDGIDCSGDAAFAFAEVAPFTYETFVFLATDGPREEDQYRQIFDRMAGGTSDRYGYYAFLHRGANSDDWTLTLERWRDGSSQNHVRASSPDDIAVGTWIHFAVTQAESGRLALYVNGTLRDESISVATPASSNVRLYLGRNQNGSCCALVGKLSNMAVYDRALDVETVARHYRAAHP
jgi:hypothetical protein